MNSCVCVCVCVCVCSKARKTERLVLECACVFGCVSGSGGGGGGGGAHAGVFAQVTAEECDSFNLLRERGRTNRRSRTEEASSSCRRWQALADEQ
jgi:hypothetical protein